MRNPSLSRIIITLFLIAGMPWCYCRLGWSTNRTNRDASADCTAGPARATCCSECGTQQHADDKTSTDDDGSGGDPTPDRNCGSPCCAPKASSAAPTVKVPCDTIGCVLPPAVIAATPTAALEPALASVAAEWPPGRLWCSHGRAVLLSSSILSI
ncbi:MAG: hypothetical protein SGJ09_12600 [Phycisphaerae bacterium]|nr:hypothetical protein [Phycisphaerae bacterium]